MDGLRMYAQIYGFECNSTDIYKRLLINQMRTLAVNLPKHKIHGSYYSHGIC